MKEMIMAIFVTVMVATAAWGQAAVRVDTRSTAGYYVATGVERVGTADGGTPIEWDTTQVEDGWWRVANDGAGNPEDYGYYFWWGDTVGYRREGDVWVASDGSSSNFSFDSENTPTYHKNITTLQSEGWIVSQDGTYVLAPEHDAAYVKWGGDWRMPTKQELDDLDYNCDWTWTTKNGVNGYEVRGRGGYASNSIFLPAPATAQGLRSVMLVRAASTGRPSRAATTRATSTSIRATTSRATAPTASPG